MIDEIPPHDDYDLLTHYEASRRLRAEIDRQHTGADAGGQRLTALEEAARRHRDHRPADRGTFFDASGVVTRLDTID